MVHASQVTVDHVGWPYRPQGLTSAQLCVATLLIEGDVFVDQFKPQAVEDRARIELSRKVSIVHDPAITALGSAFRHKVRVEVRLRDGTIESETREAPRGSEQSFAAADDIVAKFCKLTCAAMTKEHQAALVDAVLNLEKLADGKELIRLLRAITRTDGGSDGARTRDLRRDRPGGPED